MTAAEQAKAAFDVWWDGVGRATASPQRAFLAGHASRDAEVAALQAGQKKERNEIISMLRDVSSRIGVAARPEWCREEIERIANQLEVWNRALPPIPASDK